MDDNMYHGIVIYWNERDGYGFFQVDGLPDVFFHITDVENATGRQINKGDQAVFHVYNSPQRNRCHARVVVFE